mmetsp:Transcript_5873/g.13264  ORF Transcript_5873/g.13264 Transcript_5873/m.13264 type:complete len:206 (+) Transcript_5873:1178-1795(+)
MKATVIEMGAKHFLEKMRSYGYWNDRKRKYKPDDPRYGDTRTVKDAEQMKRAYRKKLHINFARLLSSCFTHIILPTYDVRAMTSRKQSLSSGISRSMLATGFCQFRDILISMCKCNPNVKLYHNADESWRSKVCVGCGEADHDLGAKKTHRCKSCGISQRRDGGAARTILIKFIFQKFKESERKPLSQVPTTFCGSISAFYPTGP